MSTTDDTTTPSAPRRRRAASRPAGPPADLPVTEPTDPAGSEPAATGAEPEAAPAPAPRARKRAAKKTAAAAPDAAASEAAERETTRSRARKATKAAAEAVAPTTGSAAGVGGSAGPTAGSATGAGESAAPTGESEDPSAEAPPARRRTRAATSAPAFSAPDEATVAPEREAAPLGVLMFQAPEAAPARRRPARATAAPSTPDQTDDTDEVEEGEEVEEAADETAPEESEGPEDDHQEGGPRRRRRRGGRGRRRRGGEDTETDATGAPAADESIESTADETTSADTDESGETRGTSRRRRRRRGGSATDGDDQSGTTIRARERSRRGGDEVTAIKGSTRLEAKKQRRREGREAGRRRPPILSEAEFLARREAVERVMVVRQITDGTQIAVLEDGVLVEHYVNRSTGASMIGNVYLGKVQNVLPSMEAAFVDIGRGRNAVLYAGEVNWDAAGLDGQPRRIEAALKSGDSVLVQVSKDPIGHKGARLTSQISLPGRFLVYVPEGQMTGISRKLPDAERNRLKTILRTIVPEDAGVIVRTASEGVSEEELTRDVQRLSEQWEQITAKAKTSSAPALLQGEQDLAIKVVRDIFNEDFSKLVVSGEQAWETIEPYVASIAPDLVDRVEKWVGTDEVFHAHRVDEQLAKALDRKVWLPSGGSLVIDRTEAMTVVDVNTGKFTGSGGNLEETVTRNNLEAVEEIVRQLRLRDIGGIIVVDFIDMVLESNRDLVLRRLLECLGRDRTKHQVAEVTSLGLVQMTRKRIGQGLLEVFSEPCEHCHGRGVLVHTEPVAAQAGTAEVALPSIRSASASAGVAKVHAAARKAAARALEGSDEPDGSGEAVAEVEPTASAEQPTPKAKSGKKGKTKAGRKSAEKAAAEWVTVEEAAAPADTAATEAATLTDTTATEAATPATTETVPPVDGAGPATGSDATVTAPPRRVRGGRRRVTRSAGPATHEESAGPAAHEQSREAAEPAV